MGLIGRILSFVRTQRNGAQISDLKTDPGGGPILTAEHFAPPGDDSFPLNTDYAYVGRSPQNGRVSALGYVDPKNTPKAQRGDKRIYSRDSSGDVVADVWLKNDGTVVAENDSGTVTLAPDGSTTVENDNGSLVLGADGSTQATSPGGSVTLAADGSILGQNGAGSFELEAAGTFEVNGVTISPAGLITTPTGIITPSAVINGVEADQHNHTQGNDSDGDSQVPTGPMQ